MKWFEHWKEFRMKWHQSLGMGEDNYRFHDHETLACKCNADIEFKFPFGFKELEGIHSRTDFDLKSHQEFSGRKIQYFDHEINESLCSLCCRNFYWADRMFLTVLSHSFNEEELENGESRVVLKIPPVLAPLKLQSYH